MKSYQQGTFLAKKTIIVKTKPVVKQGRKATGLNDSRVAFEVIRFFDEGGMDEKKIVLVFNHDFLECLLG